MRYKAYKSENHLRLGFAHCNIYPRFRGFTIMYLLYQKGGKLKLRKFPYGDLLKKR